MKVLCWCLTEKCTSAQLVRLVNSKVNGTGRLEILTTGKWSTMSSYYLTKADAKVICRMLGYNNTGIANIATSIYGDGTGPQIRNYISCSGTEANITQCSSVYGRTTGTRGHDVDINCVPSKIRLVDGSTNTAGRIEVNVQGEWLSICSSSFDIQDATVVCAMLGFGHTGIVRVFKSAFGRGSGTYMLSSPNCNGNEIDILQCGSTWTRTSGCDHRQEAGVSCGATGIRLVGGASPGIGRVEIFHAGSWGTICDPNSSFDERDVFVICRMLGYNTTNAFAMNRAFYGEGTGPVITEYVDCDGTEIDISNCKQRDWHTTSSSSSAYCSHQYDVGVNCAGKSKIRLVDGDSVQSGRVELYRHGHWGTIGSRSFDHHDLEVVCRMLGFTFTEKSFFHSSSYYGQGVGEVVADGLECDGGEPDIGNCHSVRWWPNAYQSHDADVGVNCNGEMSLRLVEGPTNGTGRLEMLHNGYYGTVCDRGFDRNDLIVVCRALGYDPIPQGAYYHARAYFGQGLGQVLVKDLACNGNEPTLGNCGASWLPSSSYCDHSNDISVSCDGGMEAVRIVNGPNKYSGRVEVNHLGQWSTVCHSSFSRADAVVICRMLDFPHPEHAKALVKSEFGRGNGTVYTTNLNCNGYEPNLDLCKQSYTSSCYSHDVAGVDCCPTCAGSLHIVG